MLVVPATLLLAAALPSSAYVAAWRTEKSLTGEYIWMLATGALLMILAAMLALLFERTPLSSSWPGLDQRQLARLEEAGTWLFRMTLFGYAALLVVGLSRGARPSDFARFVVSQDSLGTGFKELFAPVTGVTSFTQLGIAYVVVGLYLLLARPNPMNGRRLAIVLLLGVARAYFLSERLAFLELIVPAMAILAMWALARATTRLQALLQLAPVVMVPMVMGLFAIFEFSRSWVWYRDNGASNFLRFAAERFGGYYATAYNNGKILFDFQQVPGRLPYRSIEGLWSAPGVEQLGLYARLEQVSYPSNTDVLALRGNLEFNNPCGLCDPFVDWGRTGGWVFLACVGFLLGVAYLLFTSGRPIGLMAYPPMVTGLYELPRYVYWTAGRLVPSLIALFLVGWWLGRPSEAIPNSDVSSRPGALSGHVARS